MVGKLLSLITNSYRQRVSRNDSAAFALLPRYDGADWQPGSHIEAFPAAPKAFRPKWQVGCSVYLDDTAPGGGKTYVWPRSHVACHRYFQKYPGDIVSGGVLCGAAGPGRVHSLPTVGEGVLVRQSHSHAIETDVKLRQTRLYLNYRSRNSLEPTPS